MMEAAILKGLNDKFYEKRKAAALDLEKLVRECHQTGDTHRIEQIMDQAMELFSNPVHPLHSRNGGLIGLAAMGIALGVDIAPYMEKFTEPLLVCFSDNESRIRYFAAESMYNIAKVSKGEILVYFNPIFDALSKLSADSELSVKNGAELLDRLLKDTVADCAPFYVPHHPQSERARRKVEAAYGLGVLVPQPDDTVAVGKEGEHPSAKKAFSLANFIPLLADRIYVLSPFTRSFLVSWIAVLDSVPDLEMVSYLPYFLDGLLKYLSDPTEDVRVATENLLGEFLREVREIAMVNKTREERAKARRDADQAEQDRRSNNEKERLPDIVMAPAEKGPFLDNGDDEDDGSAIVLDRPAPRRDVGEVIDERDTGVWIPGQGVKVDYAAIVEILIQQLDGQHDEIQQSTALKWLHEFLHFAQDVIIPFTPRLIPAVLPSLAHHVPDIQTAAGKTNQLLFIVIQSLPITSPATSPTTVAPLVPFKVPESAEMLSPNRPPLTKDGDTIDGIKAKGVAPIVTQLSGTGSSSSSMLEKDSTPFPTALSVSSRAESPTPDASGLPGASGEKVNALPPVKEEEGSSEPFDYQAMVSALTVQFLSEHEDTRVAALKWLIMLHQKVPQKILAMDDGTFPALLKTLSDTSEEVIKHDLQLLAQISSNSEESYFKAFMVNLLDLFSTDKRLLETRGSLIIRQLCLSLNTERIYRTLAEILEKEEDLEFASDMVQKLNLILITSPELAESRKRLKTLETRQDGQAWFVTLYRSWCHNAVAAFSLCLLAQAYEHAANMLQIFAEVEITVQLLVQIDKLVQLIESPVFTYLRLQLLEPDKYPHLYKCLYGLLMLLPQSSAFYSLRNRLNAVSSLGFLHVAPKAPAVPTIAPSRSKMAREEIKFQELFNHFRAVQSKHEKSRRMGNGSAGPLLDGYQDRRPAARRRTTTTESHVGVGTGTGTGTGAGAGSPTASSVTAVNGGSVPPRALSPLNPRSSAQRHQASLGMGGGMPGMGGQANGLLLTALSGVSTGAVGQPRAMSPTLLAAQKGRPVPRGLNLGRK